MTNSRINRVLCVAVGLGCLAILPGGRAAELNRFQNLLHLLEKNLYQFDHESVDAAAVRGLLKELDGQVIHVQPKPDAEKSPDHLLSLRKSEVLEESFIYLQLAGIESGADSEIRNAIENSQNKLKPLEGIILDLRFAEGQGYECVPSVIGLFHGESTPLFSMKGEDFLSKPSESINQLPLAILVNTETSRAAELAAASLKQIKKAIVIGQKSSGQTFYFERFELDGGGTIEVARSPVKMADGFILSQNGIQPDIAIDAPISIQKIHMENPFFSESETDSQRRAMNESDLVRLKNQQNARAAGDLSPDADLLKTTETPSGEVTSKTINDPILARGIDFLKGIRFIKQLRQR